MTTDSETKPKPPLTTHILDINRGKPAQGVEVSLYAAADSQPIAMGVTDEDGRIGQWNQFFELPLGDYQIEFNVGDWFASRGESTLYPKVQIHFSVADQNHYHIPLLLSANGYSTYRGS